MTRLLHSLPPSLSACVSALALTAALAGCGATQNRTATEQLLTSDAVDRSVARIDFRPLAGQKVYLEVEYIRPVKGVGSVNAEYVISSLRQQILSAGCLLQDGKSQADYVIEPRVGALGLDGSEVIYGIPASNALGLATTLVAPVPAVPTIPEIAIAKKHAQMGASKIGVFAYHRVTREVVWQSGVSQARSNAKDSWMLGVGPFQSGTIYSGTRFAGSPLRRRDPKAEQADAIDRRFAGPRTYRRLEEIQAALPAASPQPAATTSPAVPPVAPSAAASPVVPAGASNAPAEAEVPLEFLPDVPPQPRPPPLLLPIDAQGGPR